MQLKLHKTRDGITPDLARLAARALNTRAALRQGGQAAVSIAKRAFGDASLRPASWPALKESMLAARARKGQGSAPLRASGALWQSLRVIKKLRFSEYPEPQMRLQSFPPWRPWRLGGSVSFA